MNAFEYVEIICYSAHSCLFFLDQSKQSVSACARAETNEYRSASELVTDRSVTSIFEELICSNSSLLFMKQLCCAVILENN